MSHIWQEREKREKQKRNPFVENFSSTAAPPLPAPFRFVPDWYTDTPPAWLDFLLVMSHPSGGSTPAFRTLSALLRTGYQPWRAVHFGRQTPQSPHPPSSNSQTPDPLADLSCSGIPARSPFPVPPPPSVRALPFCAPVAALACSAGSPRTDCRGPGTMPRSGTSPRGTGASWTCTWCCSGSRTRLRSLAATRRGSPSPAKRPAHGRYDGFDMGLPRYSPLAFANAIALGTDRVRCVEPPDCAC